MLPVAVRPKPNERGLYRGYRFVHSHGRMLAIPHYLDSYEMQNLDRPTDHPAILAAPTVEELETLVDRFAYGLNEPEFAGSYQGYTLVRYRGSVYGIPLAAGKVDLDEEEDCLHAGVIRKRTPEEVEECIDRVRETIPVEFAGWLPIYQLSGNCGKHPQFTHTTDPPPGYRFTYSAPLKRNPSFLGRTLGRLRKWATRKARSLWTMIRPLFGFFRGGGGFAPLTRLRVLGAMFRLFLHLRRTGAGLRAILYFLQSRHFRSQVMVAKSKGLVFLTSMPYTYGQNPWVIEIEDPTTLFYPLIHNGQTNYIDLPESPYFPIVKGLLEADHCKGILTHMKATAQLLPTLFQSEKIREKISYVPLGVKLPERWQRHDEDPERDPIHLVFINSWCQIPGNFFVRGGLDILEAFAILRERYPQLRLTLRTRLPPLVPYYRKIVEDGWVRVIDRFLSDEEMEALLAESHIFLLPAARVHIVSLLQAMSYGLGIVTSDGWGIEEVITHERNGLIVKGRYGKVSWEDETVGMLREDYGPMLIPNFEVVDGIVEAVSRMVEDRSLRKRLGRTARRDVETNYTLESWNQGLKAALDKAMGARS
jgi:glycosyltransferase involved in cell wall biosynthesis